MEHRLTVVSLETPTSKGAELQVQPGRTLVCQGQLESRLELLQLRVSLKTVSIRDDLFLNVAASIQKCFWSLKMH